MSSCLLIVAFTSAVAQASGQLDGVNLGGPASSGLSSYPQVDQALPPLSVQNFQPSTFAWDKAPTVPTAQLPTAQRFETGFTQSQEVSDYLRKYGLNEVNGAPLLATPQQQASAASANFGAVWQPDLQATIQAPSVGAEQLGMPTAATQAIGQNPGLTFPISGAAGNLLDPATALPSTAGADYLNTNWRQPGPGFASVVGQPSATLPAAGQPLLLNQMTAAKPVSPPTQVLSEGPLNPLHLQRAATQAAIVQVDELQCNPPCAAGHGVCARDASGNSNALAGGSPRCFCRSPYLGPTCGTDGPAQPAPQAHQHLLGLLQKFVPDPAEINDWHRVCTLGLTAGTLVVMLAMMFFRCPPRCGEQERRGPGCLWSIGHRANAQAERSPLLQHLHSNRGVEAAREAARKSHARGSSGRRRPGLDSVPQAFKDDSDSEM